MDIASEVQGLALTEEKYIYFPLCTVLSVRYCLSPVYCDPHIFTPVLLHEPPVTLHLNH